MVQSCVGSPAWHLLSTAPYRPVVKVKVQVSVLSHCLPSHGLHGPRNSPGQNTEVGSLSLLQGIFPIQGLNPGLPHYKRILYQLSHQGNPKTLEWVTYPFSRALSNPGVEPGSPGLQADYLPTELSGKLWWIDPFIPRDSFLVLTRNKSTSFKTQLPISANWHRKEAETAPPSRDL